MTYPYFSPLLVTASILAPLRYFFSSAHGEGKLIWAPDEKVRTIEVADMYDYNKVALQERPRVLVSRGNYSIASTGISDSMAEAPTQGVKLGLRNEKRLHIYSGTARVLIEARNKGACELVTDMVTHFLSWTKGDICDTQGFKRFADPLSVSECTPTGDQDSPVFQCAVSVPYIKEEMFSITSGGTTLKNVVLSHMQTSA